MPSLYTLIVRRVVYVILWFGFDNNQAYLTQIHLRL